MDHERNNTTHHHHHHNENLQRLPKYFLRLHSIGKGRYGDVFAVIDKRSGKRFACKTIIKTKSKGREDILVKKIKTSNHIIEILNTYETDKHIHIISELYEGGELYDFILERTLLLKHLSLTHMNLHTNMNINRRTVPRNRSQNLDQTNLHRVTGLSRRRNRTPRRQT